MIDLTQYAYRALLTQMLARVPDTYDKRDGSPIPTALGPAAWIFEGFALELYKTQLSAFVQTAVGEDLDKLAVIGGLTRYPASAAVRLGVFNAAVPIGARFSTITGANSINFTVTAAATVSDPQEGSHYYRLTAETPGSIGNEHVGPILPITAIPSLTSAQITDILVPGDDTETDDALRQRLITALTDRPFGGNIAAYREEVLAIDGVGGVQVYPTWNGGGTVKLSVLGADFLPASAELVETVQNAIDPPPGQGLGLGMAPIGAQVTVTAPESLTVNVGATLTLTPGTVISQVQQPIEDALNAYLLSVRQSWDVNVSAEGVAYAADVYIARVTAAIVGVTGVVNATGITLNGGASDLTLTQSGTTQQVPVLGTVTLSE